MANRQVFPSSLFPLRGDISAEAGSTSVIVQGLQGIPIIAPPIEPAGLDTLFYDSYNNDWFYASPWILPVGTPLQWEGYGYGSSGISWIAPDTLAFGNGTDGDVSGAAAMTALVLFGSASYYGPYDDYDPSYGPSYDQFYTSIFSGATQNWNLILPPNPGTSGQVLTTNGTGVSYWSTIASSGGSVTSFSSGNLSPLFTTSVATSTTTPALSFALNTQSANIVFAGPASGVAATPTFRALVAADLPAGTTPTPGGSSGDIQYNNAGAFGGSLATITSAGSITLPDTQVLKWGGSAYSGVGLSQLAADTLAVGNGNESDVSGAMAMTGLILFGSSYYSAYDAFHTAIYSGATQNWNLVLPETAGIAGQVLTNIGSGFTAWESLTTLGVPWSSLTGALSALAISNGANNTTFNQTTAAAWAWLNTTTGTALTTNASPTLGLGAQYYTGAASAADLWTIGSSLVAGTNGSSALTLTHTGSTGLPYVNLPVNTIVGNASGGSAWRYSAGTIYFYTSSNIRAQFNSTFLTLGSGLTLGFSSTTDPSSASADTAFSRTAAGVMALGTGTVGSTAGTLYCARIDSSSADMQGTVTSAPTNVTATNVVVAVGGATGTFTVNSTDGFTTGDTVTLSATGWTAGSGLASSTATVTTITGGTVLVLTRATGGPWVAGTYTAQTGTLTQTGGTTVRVTYITAYTSTPSVVVTPTSNAGAFFISASSTTGFTITYASSGTQTFNYLVMGNPT